MNLSEESKKLHKKLRGKININLKSSVNNKKDLALLYTPGVASVCSLIAKDPRLVYDYTIKNNSVAIITDGTSVLGLGDIGPLGALPVMEGKALLMKKFAGIDAYPICLDTKDVEEIIRTIKIISPVFGGINLEDISAPRCFEIEERLKKELDIPVFHDDQHGTAIVVLAALINALKITNRNKKDIKIVISGAGAAAVAIVNLLVAYGFVLGKSVVLDSEGIITKKRTDLNSYKRKIAEVTNASGVEGGLYEGLLDADVFIGVSRGNLLDHKLIERMSEKPIVFAMANPIPEISHEEFKKSKIYIFGTGKSDYPNQINNLLAFPGIFRGLLDSRAKEVTTSMKIAVAVAISKLVSASELKRKIIIPDVFNKNVVKTVCMAVKKHKGK